MNRQATLLRARELNGTTLAQEGWLVLDVSAFNHLTVEFQVLSAGTTGTVKVQTASANTEDASDWTDTNASAPLNSTGGTVAEVTSFMKFIRWAAENADGAIVQIHVMARQV